MTPERVSVLRSLIALEQPLAPILKDLATFDWDIEDPLLPLSSTDVTLVLQRFYDGRLTNLEVEEWANALEGREDIELDPMHGEAIRSAIFSLANPTLTESLTKESARRWISELTSPESIE